MTSLWHVATSALLAAWLASCISWCAAGAAISSWGGRPVWLGAVISSVVPVLGALAITGWATSARRERQRHLLEGQAGSTARVVDVAGGPAPAKFARTDGPFARTDGPFVRTDSPFPASGGLLGSGGGSLLPGPFELAEPAGSRPPMPGVVAKPRHRMLDSAFAAVAALLAVGYLLSTLSGDWVDFSSNVHYGAQVDAWTVGIGPLLVVSAVEFLLFVPFSWRTATRWPAVLAVFAGCWWGLLCWVAFGVTDGLHRLIAQNRLLDQAGGIAVTAGWIWIPLALLAIGSVLWGGVRLTYLHRAGVPQIVGGPS